MSAGAKSFAARVQLPCRVFCGPESILELAGTAMSIDTGSLILALPAGGTRTVPEVGEQVRLELSLPRGNGDTAAPQKSKYLSLRARVSHVMDLEDGSRQITFTFRKASFRDRVEGVLRKPPKPADGWEM